MTKLFGTDGVRGPANTYPVIPETAVRIGRAVASVLSKNYEGKKGSVVIGKDTRISCTMLEYALASGVCSMGMDACLTGILPTPGIAHLVTQTKADTGIVISASHNPFYDNGIKIFRHDGFKLSDETQAEIEEKALDENNAEMGSHIRETGIACPLDEAGEQYANFLKSALPKEFSLKGMKIVIDCANGATYQVAPKILRDLGADVITLFADPDGKNINDNCGSQHPQSLRERLLREEAHIGLAFDGDGDRLIAVDEKGNIATGDQILAVCANSLKNQGKLKNNILVSTVMSNIGLGISLEKLGITHITTNVGDRYVMQEMVSCDAIIGGEDSGHLIFLDHHTTGDGILAGLKLLEAMTYESQPFSELLKVMAVFPQELINVDVTSKPDIETIPDIKKVITSVEKELGNKGRVLVRYSGTQPMCRVMVEGPSKDQTRQLCKKIADKVKETLG